MTVLVVCLDGTDQVKDQAYPTNIARIFDTLGGDAADAGNGSFETTVAGPRPLAGKYLPGVGTQADPVLKVLGSAFGDGIAEPIVRGYTYLSRNYSPGDEVVLTGFSRGATAARALAGLIAAQGLLNSSRYDPSDKTGAYLRGVAAWYAYRAPRPDLADQARLQVIGGTVGQPVPTLGPADYTAPPSITAVGVFDTVSSLGLPTLNWSGQVLFDFSIVDTVLSDKVQNGFHALSADESRDLFTPTFWTPRVGVEQQVFPGCHSDVGGGFANRGLSDGALEWMLAQFRSVGLACDDTLLDPPLAPNPLDLAEDDGAKLPFSLTPHSPRVFPDSAIASASLAARWGKPAQMLPSATPAPYRSVGSYGDGRLLLN